MRHGPLGSADGASHQGGSTATDSQVRFQRVSHWNHRMPKPTNTSEYPTLTRTDHQVSVLHVDGAIAPASILRSAPPVLLRFVVAPILVVSTAAVFGTALELWIFGLRFGSGWMTAHTSLVLPPAHL